MLAHRDFVRDHAAVGQQHAAGGQRDRLLGAADAAVRQPHAAVAAAPSLVPGGLPTDGAWQPVYRNDFTDLRDVTRFASSATVNSALSPSDTNNSALQKPIVAADTTTVADPAATDGSALAVSTQQQSYPTPTGTAYGWTSGRMAITGQNQAPPVRIRARIRMTPSIGAKTAVMWWPAGGGWPWEVDFAETFGGATLTDFWGARQHVQQNWHSDVNHDTRDDQQRLRLDPDGAARASPVWRFAPFRPSGRRLRRVAKRFVESSKSTCTSASPNPCRRRPPPAGHRARTGKGLPHRCSPALPGRPQSWSNQLR